MNLRSFKRNGITIVAMVLTLAMVFLTLEPYTAFMAATGEKLKDKYIGFEGVPVDWKYGAGENVFSYRETAEAYAGKTKASTEVDISLSSVKDENGAVTVSEHEGRDAFFSAGEGEYFEFDVNVPEEAVYRVEFDYYLPKGSSDNARRALYVDGEYPFTEAGDLVFERFFKDEGEPVLNSIGDETRPKQITIDGWRTTGLKDSSGIVTDDFNVLLSAGKHTVRVVTMKSSMYVGAIRFTSPIEIRPYAEVAAEYAAKGYTDAAASTVNFQAELTTVEKNDPTLRRENDGDPFVVPKSDVTRKLNVMGGYRWRKGNQSITWEFNVDADGLYKIGLYVKQQWNDGLPSYRQIAIDGQVPFAELMEYNFAYDTKWKLKTLSDENDNPYLFYLTKGRHTITMTVKMGDLGAVLSSIKDDIVILSDMLLDINLIAGSSPDPNYDYKFFEKIPDMKERLEYLLASMEYKYQLASGMSEKTPAIANNFLTIRAQIQMMLDDPFSIAKKVGDLQNSQKNLSDWYLSLQSAPLVIDSFYVGPQTEVWKSKTSNFFQRLGVTFKQFISSFSKDYDNVGGVLAEDVVVTDTINVWIARGTEWAEVIKEMADEDFTPK